jgi:hypothetical protein
MEIQGAVAGFAIRRLGLSQQEIPSREAEALIRACLGEVELLDAVQPSEFSYPEIGIAIVSRLYDEWQPSLPQIYDIFQQTEDALQVALRHIPELVPGEEDWFAAGMPTSPFAAFLGDLTRPADEGAEN